MAKLVGIPFVLLATWLAGCSTLNCGDSHPYMNSVARQPLQAPSGLSVPTPDPNYAIQDLALSQSKRTNRDVAGTCLINPPQLITAQPAATKSKPTTTVKSGPVIPSPENGQSAEKPTNKGTAPAASTAVPSPAVAAPEYME